jgi:hypothetical protein
MDLSWLSPSDSRDRHCLSAVDRRTAREQHDVKSHRRPRRQRAVYPGPASRVPSVL